METRRTSPVEPAMLRRFQAGDRDAFRHLVGPEIVRLRAFAVRLCGRSDLGEDLCQEALVRAFRSCQSFRGVGSLRSWLFRITARLATEPRRYDRSERGAVGLPTEGGSLADPAGTDPLQRAQGRELRERIESEMEALPARQRAALHLRAVEGFDYAHIADVLGCSNAAARMLVLEARKKLMTRLGKDLEP